MMKWLFESKEAAAKRASRAETLKVALESSEALEKAAKGTLDLAADVTETLQAKIDDYTTQIDQTARLLNDALMLVSPEGEIQSYNPAAESMFGWKKREVVGKKISILFQFPEDPVIDVDFMESLVTQVNTNDEFTSVNYEDFKGIRKDGSVIYIDVSASKVVRSDKKIYYIMLVRDVTHQVNNSIMIRELAEHNQELITTIDASSTGFMILNPDGSDFNISFVNEGFAKLVGFKRSAIKKMNLRDLFGTDSTFWTIRRTLMEGVEGRHEIQFDIGVSQTAVFEVHLTPVKKASKPVQWILVFYDTTELKKAYQALGKSQATFKAFSDASSESLIIHDHTRLMEWNDRVILLTGYSDSELETMNPSDLLHPLERERMLFKQHDIEDSSYETLFLTKTGEVKDVAINSKPIEWDNTDARIAIVRDVTAFKDVETQLKTSRERYKTVVDNTIDLIVCFNKDFEITFSNQTFRDYFDVEVEDINGFSLLEIIPESDHNKFIKYMLEVLPGQEIRRGVHRVKRHDEIRWQDWIDRGIFDEDGNLIEVQSVIRDITHLIPSQ
jgi:PAS domain S-box-containing protein